LVSALTSTIDIVVGLDFVTVAVGGKVVVTVVGIDPAELVSVLGLLESGPEMEVEEASAAVEDPPSTGTTE
jgi:hypothetical protein